MKVLAVTGVVAGLLTVAALVVAWQVIKTIRDQEVFEV